MKKLAINLILIAGTTGFVRADATFQLANNAISRFTYQDESGFLHLLPAGTPVVIGFFWGESPSSISLLPALPLGTMSASNAGLMNSLGLPPWLVLPEVEPGQLIWARIRGWSAEFGLDWHTAMEAAPGLYAETDVRPVMGGPPLGPPSTLWQGRFTTNPNQFYPLIFPVPEPPTLALGVLVALMGLVRTRAGWRSRSQR
jgi:hypothetical protein